MLTAALGVPGVFRDNFDGAAGALGGGWSSLVGSGWTVDGSGLAHPGGTGDRTIVASAGPYAGVEVAARIGGYSSGSEYLCLVARATDANNFYMAQVSGSGTAQLYKRVAGTWTQLGSNVATGGLPGVLSFRLSGTSLSTTWNGTAMHSVTDSSLSTGSVGLRASATAAAWVDWFAAGAA